MSIDVYSLIYIRKGEKIITNKRCNYIDRNIL